LKGRKRATKEGALGKNSNVEGGEKTSRRVLLGRRGEGTVLTHGRSGERGSEGDWAEEGCLTWKSILVKERARKTTA